MVIMASGIARGGHGGVAEDGSYRLTLRHAALFISSFFYWTSLLQSIDTCQNNISTDQYHMTILQAQGQITLWSCVFLKSITHQVLVFSSVVRIWTLNFAYKFSQSSTSIRRYLPIFTCFGIAFQCTYCIVIAIPLPFFPDVYVCCHGSVNLQSCRKSDMQRSLQLVEVGYFNYLIVFVFLTFMLSGHYLTAIIHFQFYYYFVIWFPHSLIMS